MIELLQPHPGDDTPIDDYEYVGTFVRKVEVYWYCRWEHRNLSPKCDETNQHDDGCHWAVKA